MRNQKFTVSKMVDNKLVTEEISLVTNGCFYFFNAQHLYLELSPNERSYFDFMCEKMDYENRILLNCRFRRNFIKHFNSITSSKDAPSEHDLKLFEIKLKSLKLVIQVVNLTAVHMVNPKYVFAGNLTQRKKLLEKLAEMALNGDIDLTTIIDRSIDKIKPKAGEAD